MRYVCKVVYTCTSKAVLEKQPPWTGVSMHINALNSGVITYMCTDESQQSKTVQSCTHARTANITSPSAL